jgi:hypothetical protein
MNSAQRSFPSFGRKAPNPVLGLEPLQLQEKRKPRWEGEGAIRGRWAFAVLSGVVLALGGLLWSQLGVQ